MHILMPTYLTYLPYLPTLPTYLTYLPYLPIYLCKQEAIVGIDIHG